MTHFTLSRTLNEIYVLNGAEFGIKLGEDLTKQFSFTTVEVKFLFSVWKIVVGYIPTPRHWQLTDFGMAKDSVVFLIVSSSVKILEVLFFEWGRTALRKSLFRMRSEFNTLYKWKIDFLLSSETFAGRKLLPHSPAKQHETKVRGKINFTMSDLVSRNFTIKLLVLTNEHISFLTWM
jgi:hypothetical protein